jgi:hypothetical protein
MASTILLYCTACLSTHGQPPRRPKKVRKTQQLRSVRLCTAVPVQSSLSLSPLTSLPPSSSVSPGRLTQRLLPLRFQVHAPHPTPPQWRRSRFRLQHHAACRAPEREPARAPTRHTSRAPTRRMAAPGLDQVMAFLTDHGFAGAASALRDDVLARTAAGDEGHDAALGPRLPPLRMPAAGTGSGSGAGSGTPAPASPGSSSGSASSSAFVSMRSTPSGTQGTSTRHFCRLLYLNPLLLAFRGRISHTVSICALIFQWLWLRGADSALVVRLAHVFFFLLWR